MSEEHAHEHPSYVKIWGILTVLLVVSIIGPEAGIQWLTLTTAFGIAVVKAYLVAKHFMHLNMEQPYISYLMATMLVFMLLFFAGVAPDVMKAQGEGWEKPDWVAAELAAASGELEDAHGDHGAH